MGKKDAVAQSTPSALVAADVSSVELPDQQVGMENVANEDLVMPRVRLLQALSAEVSGGDSRAGTLCNSLTGEEYGDNIEVIFAMFLKNRVFFAEALKEPPVCSSPDALNGNLGVCAQCPHSAWKKKGEEGKRGGPDCTLFYNFPAIILSGAPDRTLTEMLASVSFGRTSAKAAMKLLSKVKLSGKNWWDKIYTIGTEQKTGPKGVYYILTIEDGRDTTEQERKVAFSFHQQYKGRVEISHIDPEGESSESGNGAIPF